MKVHFRALAVHAGGVREELPDHLFAGHFIAHTGHIPERLKVVFKGLKLFDLLGLDFKKVTFELNKLSCTGGVQRKGLMGIERRMQLPQQPPQNILDKQHIGRHHAQ